MQDAAELAQATAFVTAARAAGVSTLLHISTTDLRSKRGQVVSTTTYRRNVGRLVALLPQARRASDFGAWNEVNHASQETWNRIGNAVSYFKSMYSAVRSRCTSCRVVGLDVLDQAGVGPLHALLLRAPEPDVAQAPERPSASTTTPTSTATARPGRRRSSTPRAATTGARSSGSPRPARSRASARRSRTTSRARPRGSRTCSRSPAAIARRGVERVYSYNFFGIENQGTCCGRCRFDAGLVDPDGTPRPVFSVFKQKLETYSR